jgi:2-polyprenyl-6-methoxyphenol hydroxylase-like FAD-dependent oxidoreductase
MNKKPDVLVAGAGPVGLCAALALTRRGIHPVVVDEAWRPASHTYGVALHPHSLDVLESVGVLPALLPRGQRVDGMYLYDRAEQRAWMSFAGVPAGHPFVLAVPQAVVEEELVAALHREGVEVLWNHRIAALDTNAPDGRPTVTLERLAKESGGYGTSTTSWVVDKTWTLTPRCVIGADGYDSMVRRSLGIELEPLAAPVRYLSVEVSGSDRGGVYDLRVILGETYTDAVWPLQNGGCRCTLQLPALDGMQWRSKQRARWAASAAHSPDLDALLARRLPWLDEGAEIGWAGAATFEPSLAKGYGRGKVWLAGDAAHVASPLGVQSLNMGLREAYGLATVVAEHFERGAADGFAEYDEGFRTEWRQLLGAVPLVAVDPWLQQNATRLISALPATGEALAHLLRRLGIQAPVVRRRPASAVEV